MVFRVVVFAGDEVPVAIAASVYWCGVTGFCGRCDPGGGHDLLVKSQSEGAIGLVAGNLKSEIDFVEEFEVESGSNLLLMRLQDGRAQRSRNLYVEVTAQAKY